MNKADNDPHSTDHGNSRKTGIIIAAIVVLTLLAVWLVPSDKPKHADIPLPAAKPAPATEQQQAQPAADQAQVQAATEPMPAPATDEATADTPGETVYREGQEAREFITMTRQNDAPMDTLFRKAEELSQSGKAADAYLLYFQAARQGHARSSIALAKQADPAFFTPDNSILDKPNITQARKWYQAAIDAGDNRAAELLENLQLHVQTQAAAGDPEASRLLLQWK